MRKDDDSDDHHLHELFSLYHVSAGREYEHCGLVSSRASCYARVCTALVRRMMPEARVALRYLRFFARTTVPSVPLVVHWHFDPVFFLPTNLVQVLPCTRHIRPSEVLPVWTDASRDNAWS